jgi:hypothetical protein
VALVEAVAGPRRDLVGEIGGLIGGGHGHGLLF